MQARELEHFLGRLEELNPVRAQVTLTPEEVGFCWGASTDEIGARGVVEDIDRVSLAHTADTYDADVQLSQWIHIAPRVDAVCSDLEGLVGVENLRFRPPRFSYASQCLIMVHFPQRYAGLDDVP